MSVELTILLQSINLIFTILMTVIWRSVSDDLRELRRDAQNLRAETAESQRHVYDLMDRKFISRAEFEAYRQGKHPDSPANHAQ